MTIIIDSPASQHHTAHSNRRMVFVDALRLRLRPRLKATDGWTRQGGFSSIAYVYTMDGLAGRGSIAVDVKRVDWETKRKT